MTTTEAEHTVTFEEATALLKRSQVRLEAADAKGIEAASLICLGRRRLSTLLASLLLPGRAIRGRKLIEESARLEREAELLLHRVRQATIETPPPAQGPATGPALHLPKLSRQTPAVHLLR